MEAQSHPGGRRQLLAGWPQELAAVPSSQFWGWGSECPWEGSRSCSIFPAPAAQASLAPDLLRRAHTALRTHPGLSSMTVWLLPFPPSHAFLRSSSHRCRVENQEKPAQHFA